MRKQFQILRKTRSTSLAVVFVLVTMLPVQGQQLSNLKPTLRTYGYMDGRTGIFHADRPVTNQADSLDDSATSASTGPSGTFNITLNITIDPKIPASDTLSCNVEASVSDFTSNEGYVEYVTLPAKRIGSTATCTGTIEYQWPTISSSNSGVLFSAAVTAGPQGSQRGGNRTLGTIAIPTSGSTTNKTFSFYI